MRNILSAQMRMGEKSIEDVEIDLTGRDEIPELLLGLKHIYMDKNAFKQICDLMIKTFSDITNLFVGRKGMDLWKILVLGTLRLCCGWDYDKLQEIANNHITLRQILGHSIIDFSDKYKRQTLHDNLRLFTPELLDKINKIVVESGLKILKDDYNIDSTHCRCDSFVVETDVHFPTDINLLWDALRVSIRICHNESTTINLTGWRQASHLLLKCKSLYRTVQNERNRDKNSEKCIKATQNYINEASNIFKKVEITIQELFSKSPEFYKETIRKLNYFVEAGEKLVDQIVRRCFKGEIIPHEEKIFSLFEPHTEWISKGKAGVAQELGIRVCIIENDKGFILGHEIMEKKTDDAIAVKIIKDTKKNFPQIESCSFDKGFYSPENKQKLMKILDNCVLPKKGRLNNSEYKFENSENFKNLRKQHSAVESAINALEHNGLDKCCDSGIEGFKRYVSYSVLARNLQLIGVLQKKIFLYGKAS